MKKEFTPYQESLDMRELGFDEPCFGLYYRASIKEEPEFLLEFRSSQYYVAKGYVDGILAPTFSQAFRWFRERYGYFVSPTESDDGTTKKYDWLITKTFDGGKIFIKFIGYKNSYDEAQLECLKKLIERIKNEKVSEELINKYNIK